MKKLFACAFIACALAFAPSQSKATTYTQGYLDGFNFALTMVTNAVDQHPEWSLVYYTQQYWVGSTQMSGYFIGNSDAQAAMLAVNYVHAGYYSGITERRTINVYYEGYYDGYLAGTAAVVLGQ